MKNAGVIYIGLRYNGNKMSQVFLYKGKEIRFSNINHRRLHIGTRYEYLVETEQMLRNPPEMGKPEEDQKLIEKWQSEEWVAIQERKKIRFKDRLKKHPRILEELPKLQAFIKELKYSERRYLIDYIFDKLDEQEDRVYKIKVNARIAKAFKNGFKTARKKSR